MKIINWVKKNKIESAVLFNFILRVSQIFIQLFSIIFISKFLNSVEIGYFYVLNSYAGLSIFFELGFSYVIMQHAAHESSVFTREQLFEPNTPFGKLASLFRFTIKWYIYSALLFVIIVYFTAYYFFYTESSIGVNWNTPLLVLMISIALSSFLNGIYNFLEGCLFITNVSKIRFVQNIFFIILFYLFLKFGLNLLSYGASLLLSHFVAIIFIFKSKFSIFLKNLYRYNTNNIKFNWKKDILPLQWKIAISSASGYFIYQIINLLAFKFQGPVLSGKYGFTMSVLNGVMIVTTVWASSRAPILSNLYAQKKLFEFQKLFINTLKSIIITFLILIATFLVFKIIVVDKYHLLFYNKFVDNSTLLLLCGSTFCNCIVAIVSTYSRVNKDEPYLIPSIVGALINTILGFVILKHSTINRFCLAMLLTNILIGMPWNYIIYLKSKKKFNINV